MKKVDQYSAEYKTTVAIAALRGELPLLELAAKYQVHPTLVKQWERQAREGLSAIFSNKKPEHSRLESSWDTKESFINSRLSLEERYYFSCLSNYECSYGKEGGSGSPA